MSRIRSRAQVEVCGDCGASGLCYLSNDLTPVIHRAFAPHKNKLNRISFHSYSNTFCTSILCSPRLDPSWASINRGILLCAECCSIHRSLGRHISLVKSLRQGCWSPAVLNYVNTINAHGANSVWEHCLMDAVAPKNLKRKPSPKDPLHPTKAEFIRAKHVNLSFILKPNVQQMETDDNINLEIELSKQLHASVRSGNLETSLRLLVQGADPNFFHEVRSVAQFVNPTRIRIYLDYWFP